MFRNKHRKILRYLSIVPITGYRQVYGIGYGVYEEFYPVNNSMAYYTSVEAFN